MLISPVDSSTWTSYTSHTLPASMALRSSNINLEGFSGHLVVGRVGGVLVRGALAPVVALALRVV